MTHRDTEYAVAEGCRNHWKFWNLRFHHLVTTRQLLVPIAIDMTELPLKRYGRIDQ